MLKEILENAPDVKYVEIGDLITPIDKFTSGNCYRNESLTQKIKGYVDFSKGDEFEIQVVTPQEVVAYVKDMDLYVVLQPYELEDFENLS